MDFAIITVTITLTAVIFLCVSSFLTGAYIASNSLKFQNCFTEGTPCMDVGGEQRTS